ncbi:hypothetical protein [Sinorhizobium sp. BG8]|uniref:hypothetical protein n=1 Tax=Sinorhizobium sp. BG8 TaxID=2613773 RepID=UPI00193E1DB6|nr:hypothetical protein [Sinorhizobium sp. BG8]QRM53745.1 hypothetical protein F3Y30_03630 [Sinorhizobium sp. BG8]
MKHHAVEHLQIVAKVEHEYPARPMSRLERLERWAELLERNPHRLLSTLHQTEYQPAALRAAMRDDDTPISVAFEDPVLRAAGLEDDSYGSAKQFFELSDKQLHKVICYCHFGATVSAATAARYIRTEFAAPRHGIFARLRAFFAS